ncbi:MAG TPA: SDR family oxidoreductase [Mycobacteriales bacterium]|nr:SDR family oxidoreductase [Mycobacteriales bacterium]
MTTYLVTGGTGFIGRHLVDRLLARDGARVLVLVRSGSTAKLDRFDGRVEPVIGDLTEPWLGVSSADRDRLRGQVDEFVHVAALYDMTADDETNQATNVGGTSEALALAVDLEAGRFHHVSSVAVAGEYDGEFSEEMFDEGQHLPSAYHRTKFDAERLVRQQTELPWRVYRPAVVVGHSQTGEMDKIDGPYYFFPALARLAQLPSWMPIVAPDLGDTNVVPVDYVAEAMDVLMHRDGLDGRAFHLVAPEPQPLHSIVDAFSVAAGGSRLFLVVGRSLVGPVGDVLAQAGRMPGATIARDVVLDRLAIPPEVVPHMTFRTVFTSDDTQRELADDGITVPALDSYADRLWEHWESHLDPSRARRPRAGGALQDRAVVITGASSGIGRATALAVAEQGGVPLLVARSTDKLEDVRDEIEAAGGRALVYSCDLTDEESVAATVKQMLEDCEEGIDYLVNNAGRSIRRSVRLSQDRQHDYERTMALNYFAPVRLIYALLPHMSARHFGHIVNISSIGVQTAPPRFSAYVASKAALDAFSRVAASETWGDGVTFTTIHMPLVRTPMISPTKLYDAFPTLSPEEAADLVIRALVDRPKRVSTRLGTLGEVAYAITPKAVDAVLHVAYRVFPDSKAAGGEGSDKPSLTRGAQAMVKLLPGVHW